MLNGLPLILCGVAAWTEDRVRGRLFPRSRKRRGNSSPSKKTQLQFRKGRTPASERGICQSLRQGGYPPMG
jgi:hypothetical protein